MLRRDSPTPREHMSERLWMRDRMTLLHSVCHHHEFVKTSHRGSHETCSPQVLTEPSPLNPREKKCADQLIQLPPSAQATAPVLDATRSKFAGPRSFERQESRMGFEGRRNCELCASFSRLSNEDAP